MRARDEAYFAAGLWRDGLPPVVESADGLKPVSPLEWAGEALYCDTVPNRALPLHSTGPMGNLLWVIILILVIMWLGGFAFHVGGGLIHILLVIALILLIVRLATGRKVL